MSQQNKKQQNKANARQSVSVSFTNEGWEDYQHWQSADEKMLERINVLIEQCRRTPFHGAGKPEALSGSLSGYWSRRIDHEHRLVYFYEADNLIVLACRYHYE